MQQRRSSRRLSERSPNWQRHSLRMRTLRYFVDTVLPNFESTRNEGSYEYHCFQVNFMKRRWHDLGWHNGLHRRATGKWNMSFYLLIDLLHQEARVTELRIRLVSEKKPKRIQRAKYRSLQAKTFELWDDFSNQIKNADQLLKQCAHLNGPCKAIAHKSL